MLDIKKYRLKKWVLYLILIIVLCLFMFVCDRLQLITIIDKTSLDITNLIIFIIVYEILRKTIKTIIKREEEEN
ncbi:MAG: hypothetical protein MSA56_06005 [Clostridium sp.]|nr:hypothetical protein [Clostridium sp.]